MTSTARRWEPGQGWVPVAGTVIPTAPDGTGLGTVTTIEASVWALAERRPDLLARFREYRGV